MTDAELMAVLNERDRLRTELAEQKRLNLQLAERLRACSECLGRVAERRGFDLAAVVAAQAHKGDVSAIMGKWPGDETDEEIAAALEAEKGGKVSQGDTGRGP